MQRLKALSTQLIINTNCDFKRYLYNRINWGNRLIILKGPKGVGKTTLMLQHIKETFEDLTKVIYVNLDHFWFTTHDLFDFVDYYQAHGVTYFFFDEAHKYPNWQIQVKNVYDYFPDLHLVVSGSSLLKLQSDSADLSRRKREYELSGLSFREFLKFEGIASLPQLTLQQITEQHEIIAAEITSNLKVLPHFDKYLKYGYYPFYREEGDGFAMRLQNVVEETVCVDIPAVSNLEYASVYKLRQLLSVLADGNPYTLNMMDLCQKLQTSRNTVLKAFDLLQSGAIIRKMYSLKSGLGRLAKPEKILFDNTNLIYALSTGMIGTVRETFFAAQVSKDHSLCVPNNGDFLVDNTLLFEVGGRNKSFNQIKDLPNSYIVSDDIEIGAVNRIPLWLFGLMY